jgi:5-methylcytosine-specific restriction protein A
MGSRSERQQRRYERAGQRKLDQRRLRKGRTTTAEDSTPPIGVGGSAPRKPYDRTNRPRTTTKSSGARGDYDSAAWKRESRAFLAANPTCACGCGRAATIVDHIVPVRPFGDPRFFDRSNWQGLAWPCHRLKSRVEQGERGDLGAVQHRGPTIRGADLSGRPLDPNHPWNKT